MLLGEVEFMTTFKTVIRQWALGLVTGALVTFMLVTPISCRYHPSVRVRDKLSIWTHPAGSHNGYYLAPHTLVDSQMTPVEGARYLGIENIYFIHFGDQSPPLSEYRKQHLRPRARNGGMDSEVDRCSGRRVTVGLTAPGLRNLA